MFRIMDFLKMGHDFIMVGMINAHPAQRVAMA